MTRPSISIAGFASGRIEAARREPAPRAPARRARLAARAQRERAPEHEVAPCERTGGRLLFLLAHQPLRHGVRTGVRLGLGLHIGARRLSEHLTPDREVRRATAREPLGEGVHGLRGDRAREPLYPRLLQRVVVLDGPGRRRVRDARARGVGGHELERLLALVNRIVQQCRAISFFFEVDSDSWGLNFSCSVC